MLALSHVSASINAGKRHQRALAIAIWHINKVRWILDISLFGVYHYQATAGAFEDRPLPWDNKERFATSWTVHAFTPFLIQSEFYSYLNITIHNSSLKNRHENNQRQPPFAPCEVCGEI